MGINEIKTIRLRAGVRYWEDTIYNGEEDVNLMEVSESTSPRMQFAVENNKKTYISPYGGYDWVIDIDPKMGKIIGWKEGNTADVHYKTCDDNTIYFYGDNDELLGTYECYVPDFLCPADEGYGDYVIMHICEDGTIDNWRFTQEDIDKTIESAF